MASRASGLELKPDRTTIRVPGERSAISGIARSPSMTGMARSSTTERAEALVEINKLHEI